MPEIEYPMLVAAEEARAQYHIRLPFQDGAQELRVFLRVVLEVRILNNDDLTTAALKPRRRAAHFPQFLS